MDRELVARLRVAAAQMIREEADALKDEEATCVIKIVCGQLDALSDELESMMEAPRMH